LKLLVGLGNPGSEYERTRHNVGFMVADRVARRLGASFASRKFGAEIAEAEVAGEKVLVLKPQTFMNHSGEPVGQAARFYKVDPVDVVVAHDDLELDPFRVQVKVGGGHGGNNGLKSVNAHLNTPDYVRVRVGIGRPPHPSQSAGFVLARFPKGFEGPLEECVELAADAVLAVAEQGAVKAMNEFNRRKQPA
jgi:peptidyl-tRNA hydrolase, PTH1 family